jgi:cullin 4
VFDPFDSPTCVERPAFVSWSECGPAFTSKLEIMAKDIDLSNDIMRAYRTSSSADAEAFDVSVAILTTGNWPNYVPVALNLPVDMVRALDRFKMFYTTKYSGRTLHWQHSLDQCTLRADFPKGRKELAVSLYQALVLLLFNDLEQGTKLGFKDIVSQTLIGDVLKAAVVNWGFSRTYR